MLLLLYGQTNLKFTFKEKADFTINGEDKLTILELSSFLYDFNLLHDCISLAAIPDYSNYRFSQYFWYRNGRPLKDEHKLYLERINHNSPLGLEVIIPLTAGALGIPWLILQAVEKIQNWNLNREKLRLEVEKLQLDNNQKRLENQQRELQLDNILLERNAEQTFERIIKRLEERKLIATDVEVVNKTNSDTNDTERQPPT